MSFNPAAHNFSIWRTATFRPVLTLWTDIHKTHTWDLTGYSAEFLIKDKVGGTTLITLTNSSGITLGDTDGTIAIVIDAATTGTLAWKQGVYQLKITAPSGGDTYPLLRGSVTVAGI